MSSHFIHLRIHSEYSLVDGIVQLDQLMEKAVQLNMPAIALTDQSNLFAAVKFYQAAIQNGIKPIMGADIWLENPDDSSKPFRCTLLCQHNEGYQNLLEIISRSFSEGQSLGKAIVKRDWLAYYSHGLIILSGAREGDVGCALLNNHEKKLNTYLEFWLNHFPHRYYLELQRTGRPLEEDYIHLALNLASKKDIPVVATQDVRFLEVSDFEAHEARVCIQEGHILSNPERPKLYSEEQYLKSAKEMRNLFSDIPEAIENSIEIAKRCTVTLTLGKYFLPHFNVPDDYDAESYLVHLAHHGLEDRLKIIFGETISSTQRKAYEIRLQHELDVINKMGFAGYFLIVADFIQWSRKNAIPVGPGRGSGPGSLVAYALYITDLDPIAHDLLFERFLNPERISMPDFDIDFCMERRDLVIDYVMQTHGRDCVAQIITYGTMAARAVVRDVGRVLGMPYGQVDKIAKLIPFELGMTLQKALAQEPLLNELYEKEDEIKLLIDLAKKLEGITRNAGKHAGGVVIAPGKLTQFTPLYCEPDAPEHLVTQFDKDDVESVGLVKFDFLGLRTLTIIDWAVQYINQFRKENNEELLDIQRIPINDAKTFELLKACKTTAVFQLESRGMKDLVRRLQPDCFEDIVALVALFRPGPLQSGMVEDFINRKHGRSKVFYPHPKLEPILRGTYGVIVYQEQVMQIAQALAGYTLGAADLLRRAMGKKKPEEMAKQRETFCKGAIERGIDTELATHIFDLMEKFAGYGFNKSHSASYALLAYQTAWLKAHYPAAYMAAVLSSDMDHTDKVVNFIEESTALGLKIDPPNINESFFTFTVCNDTQLRYGLGAIKGVGQAAVEAIIESRKLGGMFKDLGDFCCRVDMKKINKRTLESLIKAGAFDTIIPHRASALASLPLACRLAEQTALNSELGQQDLFGHQDSLEAFKYVIVSPGSEQEQLMGEKETLGLYLSGHPISNYLPELNQFISYRLNELHSPQQTILIAGMITGIRYVQTKRGDRMAILTLDDASGQIDVLAFSEIYQKYRDLFIKDKLVIASGELSIDDYNGGFRVVAQEIFSIEKARERYGKYLRLTLSSDAASSELIPLIANRLNEHKGGACPIYIDYQAQHAGANLKLGADWRIIPSDGLLHSLKELLSEPNVKMVYE